ncbi:MAG: response regulator [Rhodopirellula sp.]|nr:response regulator [Rhodopirellula sp.]
MIAINRILAIEDDLDIQANLRDILELDGYEVDVAARISEVLKRRNWSDYTAILLDRQLPDGSAEELLPKLVELAPMAAVVIVTGHSDFEGAITALRYGVSDYILKPIDPESLRFSLQRIVRVREAEERAQQAERLAAIGEMMTVLAHESRNSFQLASLNLDMLDLQLEGNDEGHLLIERIHKCQDKVSRLFEDVRGYASPIHLDRTSISLITILHDTADQIRTLNLSRKLCINIAAVPERQPAPVVSIDVSRIEQVFRNLMENSIAACSDQVEIEIACTVTGMGQEAVIEVRYRDNGPGLSTECRRRIFEPFFTTKPKGTGLGMAISQRIVQAHGGSLKAIAPEEHFGAEFLITLPAGHDSSHNDRRTD